MRKKNAVDHKEILAQLKSWGDPEAVKGMARYGINSSSAYGVSIPKLRNLAKQVGKDHELAQKLWASGIHEARILASMIDVPDLVGEAQMDRWAHDFNSWDLCDQCCNNLFRKTPFARRKVAEWNSRPEEFVRRAAFTLIACLAVHDKKAMDKDFEALLPLVRKAASDERNYVMKAVNWALRQIGKRNARLNESAINAARELSRMESKSARWIAADALRELTSKAVQERLAARN
ncbi:MAG: DNA alkylation repair protein [Thermodesulfobacteriota bacterium]